MSKEVIRDIRRHSRSRYRILDYLMYLPGAIIITYGLWLTMTTG